jgi:hypothetical protein
MKTKLTLIKRAALLVLLSTLNFQPSTVLAQGTAFTYQGQLQNNGGLASGTYNLTFSLYTNRTSGTAVAGPVTNNTVNVTNGLFTVLIDFGASVWNGATNWLQIGVETNGGGSFTTLTPRQQLTPAPYAIYSENSGLAVEASGVASGTVSAPQLNTLGTPGSGQVLGYNGSSLIWTNPSTASFAWNLTGNAGTTVGPNFVGTTDNQPLELHVNGQRALRLEPNATAEPNIIGGAPNNSITPGVVSATIAGGEQNTVSGSDTTIGGGYDNSGDGIFAVIGGGYKNQANGPEATVAGGANNIAGPQGSTVAGGFQNQASGQGSFVGGGGFDGSGFSGNTASGGASTVAGGFGNQATNTYATVGGGSNNLAGNMAAFVGGGIGNQASGDGAFIGGGGYDGSTFSGNSAQGGGSVIGGGIGNIASSDEATVGGGEQNTASGQGSFVGGGIYNNVGGGGIFAVVSGGYQNHANGPQATVGGGSYNIAGPQNSTVAGGYGNQASGSGSFVGGGGFDGSGFSGNTASGGASTVAGGFGNQAANTYATVGGGLQNSATGFGAVVMGGSANIAEGRFSFAGGQNAVAASDGTFVWADSNTNVFNPLILSGPQGFANSFNVRSTAGFYIATGVNSTDGQITSGVYVAAGGSGWNTLSDRNAKTHFSGLDATDVLRRLLSVPVLSWNYKSQDASVRHIGPMAQDFNAAFGVGEPDKAGERKYINSLDEEGVALAAIQGLNQKLEEKDAEIQELKQRFAVLEKIVLNQKSN